MNPLANELNKVIDGTVAAQLLSSFGKRFFFPKGIAAQSAEATAKAKRHNATIGMSYTGGSPMILPSVQRQMPELSPQQAVSYAPNAGDAALRDLWKKALVVKNPDLRDKPISTPMVVSGLTNGICQLADLFTDPGDVLIVPDMFWGNYRLIFEARKEASVVTFPFYTESGGFNVEAMVECLGANQRGGKATIILNFPNNPTGYSPTVEEAGLIVDALTRQAESGTRMLVIVDDAYYGLFYEEETYKQSLFATLADAHDNILAAKVDGPTKEDFVWGFRLGFITFGSKSMNAEQYGALEKKLLGAIRSSISNSPRPAQSLLLTAMQTETYEQEKHRFFGILSERYRLVRDIVAGNEGSSPLQALPFNSGYFMSFRFNGGNAEELRQKLLDERGIGTISIQDTYLRVAYAAIERDALQELYGEIFEAAASLV